jgi:quercetin dioxygenase-like cupin family protein
MKHILSWFTSPFASPLITGSFFNYYKPIKNLIMNQQIKKRYLLSLCITLAIVACNQPGKKEEATKVTDTTSIVQTEAAQPAAVDAVIAAPGLYKVLKDSMGIRIVEATYKPGDSSAWHSHPDYAVYTAQGGTATFYRKDGAKTEAEMKTGSVSIKPAEFHSVKNTGKSTLKVILVEVNRPMGTMAQDAATDASKVAGNLYKMLADSMGIRVLQITYKPGQSSALHSHPDNALYVIDASKTEFTDKDGKKSVYDITKGMTMIGPAETHSVKNIGNNTMRAILVEVNRPLK